MTLDELDKLAAEKVMGFTEYSGNMHPRGWEKVGPGFGEYRCIQQSQWQPTRNIAQAWELWEKLRESREFCCMDIRAPTSEGWEVSITKSVGEKHVQVALVGGGDSEMGAPETITRACLKAKGVEV